MTSFHLAPRSLRSNNFIKRQKFSKSAKLRRHVKDIRASWPRFQCSKFKTMPLTSNFTLRDWRRRNRLWCLTASWPWRTDWPLWIGARPSNWPTYPAIRKSLGTMALPYLITSTRYVQPTHNSNRWKKCPIARLFSSKRSNSKESPEKSSSRKDAGPTSNWTYWNSEEKICIKWVTGIRRPGSTSPTGLLSTKAVRPTSRS